MIAIAALSGAPAKMFRRSSSPPASRRDATSRRQKSPSSSQPHQLAAPPSSCSALDQFRERMSSGASKSPYLQAIGDPGVRDTCDLLIHNTPFPSFHKRRAIVPVSALTTTRLLYRSPRSCVVFFFAQELACLMVMDVLGETWIDQCEIKPVWCFQRNVCHT